MIAPNYIQNAVTAPENFVLGVLDGSGLTLKDVMDEVAANRKSFICLTDAVGLADERSGAYRKPCYWFRSFDKRLYS